MSKSVVAVSNYIVKDKNNFIDSLHNSIGNISSSDLEGTVKSFCKEADAEVDKGFYSHYEIETAVKVSGDNSSENPITLDVNDENSTLTVAQFSSLSVEAIIKYSHKDRNDNFVFYTERKSSQISTNETSVYIVARALNSFEDGIKFEKGIVSFGTK